MTTDPNDWIADLLVVENPIKEAHDCGDGVTFETYSRQAAGVTRGHPDFVMDGKDLKGFDHCPHRWRAGHNDDDETAATDWGQLLDCLLITPSAFESRFAVAPATYPSTGMKCPSCGSVTDSKTCRKCNTERAAVTTDKDWDFNATYCREWKEKQHGRHIVRDHECNRARSAAELIMSDEQYSVVIPASRRQVMLTGFYDDKETGLRIPIKSLLDLVPPEKYLVDLKTSKDAHPRPWKQQVWKYRLHVQAARHLDLWNAAHQDTRNEFRHIVQESFPPFEIGKRMLAAEFISLGRYQYVKALKRYAECLKRDEWPGYDETDNNADLVIDEHLVVSPESWMVGG